MNDPFIFFSVVKKTWETHEYTEPVKKFGYSIYSFLLPMYGTESIALAQIVKMEILMELYVLKSPDSENYIFSSWAM